MGVFAWGSIVGMQVGGWDSWCEGVGMVRWGAEGSVG